MKEAAKIYQIKGLVETIVQPVFSTKICNSFPRVNLGGRGPQ